MIETTKNFIEVQNNAYATGPVGEAAYPVRQLLPLSAAGVTAEQATSLNKEWIEMQMRIQEKITLNSLELDLMYQKEVIKRQFEHGANDRPVVLCDGKSNVCEMAEKLIESEILVKNRARGANWEYFWRNRDANRHEIVSESELRREFQAFCEMNGIENLCGTELERAMRLLTTKIPVISDAKLKIAGGDDVVLRNGVINLKSGEFSRRDSDRLFNRFSIDADYREDYPEPEAFNALLHDCFDGDENLMKLAYEIIGALMTPMMTMKKVFVLQGVSGGGKTRLAEIIMNLVGELDCDAFNTISDVVNESVAKGLRSKRLIYFKDAADRKITPKQAAYLKGYADGGNSRFAALFKILMCTNHPLVTSDDGAIETALAKRFLVLPFAKAMTNEDERVACFEELYFGNEREAIISKALQAFGEVVRNGGRFCIEPVVNSVVETPKAAPEQQSYNFEELLWKHFAPAEKPITSASVVFEILSAVAPDLVKGKNQLGKLLANVAMVQKLKTSENILYNIIPKGGDINE